MENYKREFSKALGVCLIISLLFTFLSVIGLSVGKGGDFDTHFQKSKNGCGEITDADSRFRCEVYAPLLSWASKFFSFSEKSFLYFNIFLIGIVTPMLLFHITRTWVVAWFYFSTTNYFYYFVEGVYAQALAGVLVLTILATKNPFIRLLALVTLILAHGHGWMMGLLVLSVLTISEGLKKTEDWCEPWSFFPVCSGVFGKTQLAEAINKPIAGWTAGGETWSYNDILHLFGKIFPLPFLVLGVSYYLRFREKIHFLVIGFLSVAIGFFVSPRVFYLLPLVMLPGLAWYTEQAKPEHRHWILAASFLSFVFMFYSWANFKLVCVA